MKRLGMSCAVLSAVAVLSATESKAAGFALQEQSASGLGNAYAGAAAVAEGADTVWWNPAGMARLGSGKHFSVGGTYIMPSTKFSNNGSTVALASNPALTGDGGNAGKSALIPNMYYAMEVDPRWNFGI